MPVYSRIAGAGWIALTLLFVGKAEALELVRDGKPLATIVRRVESAPETKSGRGKGPKRAKADMDEGDEALAVQILVDWLKKITDAELPVAESAPEGSTAVYVGQAAVAAGLKLDDIASPSHEGLRIVSTVKGTGAYTG